ncbi:hypothetical protein PGTUg99_023999 [Puccinia graminis f. sp. tritici]|uniref:Uncharacterized protein n=1 Tax=Puccinia graminis f. sp. tritici TaxID=56615 RepID=A0A5B0NKJ7_PUCGR|nr:hypothetical protein PGTUg99_023999 [Puccinia graminis f. sp. tritici]
MARERIISLRLSSQEYHGITPDGSPAQDDPRRESRLQAASRGEEEGNTIDEEAERLLSPDPRRSGSRPPKLVVQDYSLPPTDHRRRPGMTGGEREEKKSRHSPLIKSSGGPDIHEHPSIVTQHEVDEDEDDRRTLATVDDQYDHPLLKHVWADPDGPIVSAAGQPDIDAEKAARFPLEAGDMGHFMNQASKISTRIDGLEAQLLENSPSFSNDPAFRTALHSQIDHHVVQQILLLQATHRLDSSPSFSPDIDDDNDHHHHDWKTVEKRRLTPSTLEIEHALKVEQILALKTKAKSLVSGMIGRLKDEKQITTSQIEYEWNKELSQGSASSRHSRSVSTIVVPDARNPSIDSSPVSPDHQLFEKLQQIDHLPRASKSYSEEVQKILNLAVRSSTSYPEARKSSLFIKSKVDSVLQIHAEVDQLNRYLVQLSSDCSRQYGHEGTSSSEDEDDDDLSSISISLDGLDEEDKGRLEPEMSKRKTNKIRFMLGDRPKKNPQSRSSFVEDLENNRVGNKEPQCHRLSYGSNSSYPISFHDNRSWLVRYRLTVCCSILAFESHHRAETVCDKLREAVLKQGKRKA